MSGFTRHKISNALKKEVVERIPGSENFEDELGNMLEVEDENVRKMVVWSS